MTVLLTDLSPRDSKFVANRDQTESIGDLLEQFDYHHLSQKFNSCGNFLEFKLTETHELKLFKANFCKSALCPMCSWRRARQWRRRLLAGLRTPIFADHRWLFLTLTIKNRPLNDLANSLDQLNQGWQELQKNHLEEFLNGYIRGIEINRALKLGPTEMCHPHIHALLSINPKYFSDYYLRHHEWRRLWKQSIKEEYLPIVNIKSIATGINPRLIGEIAKYTLKPGSFFSKYRYDKQGNIIGFNWYGDNPKQEKADFFAELYNQIYHRRLISSGGIVKSALGTEAEDLIGGQDGSTSNGSGWTVRFSWRREGEALPNYYLHE